MEKRTSETIELCVDVAMAEREEFNGRTAMSIRDAHDMQVSMILTGVLADSSIMDACEALSPAEIKDMLGPVVNAALDKLRELTAGDVRELCRPVREIQKDLILAGLTAWDQEIGDVHRDVVINFSELEAR